LTVTATKQELRRELGFWIALTIGAGTMIGAGIFLLSGVAITLAGPAAVFSYIIAGIICIITAASAAELATGMPTSGGDYFFVSRSLGPAFGAISGIGIWLSLTFAISFYLFGLGEYLHSFLPISPLWGAVIGGIALTALNVIGAKESGSTQMVVVLVLIGILVVFIIAAAFNIDPRNWIPFFPNGTEPILATTALVFISFLGFVKIAAVSEEIKDPSKNLPRALIGSVALVTMLYILIVLVLSGFFTQEEIAQTTTPLTVAAEQMFGRVGAAVLIFAGLLATLSSANASIMAASRINLAMSRDQMVPKWLSEIHRKRLTPYRAILLTGALGLLFLAIDSLESLAEIASVLQLYSYAALNIGVVILRGAAPDWYKPSFRLPGSPYLPIFAALGCVIIILFSGLLAQAIILLLIIVSLLWYFFYGRLRVDIRYGLPLFRKHWQEEGWRLLFKAPEKHVPVPVTPLIPAVRRINSDTPRRVIVALANPKHRTDLLRMARYLATGAEQPGQVYGMHLVKVPIQTPLRVARSRFAEKPSIERDIANLEGVRTHQSLNERPVAETKLTAVTDVAHDVFGSLIAETSVRQADLLLMGWQGDFNVSQIYNSPVQRIITGCPADVGVFKDRGLEDIRSILIPWGGGPHAQLGLEFAARIGQATGARIDVLRVVQPHIDLEAEREALEESAQPYLRSHEHTRCHVVPNESFPDGLMAFLDESEPDLIIIGASHEWRVRSFLFGSIPDLVADYAKCSVLMVRRHLLEH
jgi:amino acid transporter/nucleotide-binding universal stress UspA family protein